MVGVDDPELDWGEIRALTPTLPLLQQGLPTTGIATPTRTDTAILGGFRDPEGRLPSKNTRVTSQVFADSRDRDVVRIAGTCPGPRRMC